MLGLLFLIQEKGGVSPRFVEAWERAHHYYTSTFDNKGYSDIQEQRPVPIEDLENAHLSHR